MPLYLLENIIKFYHISVIASSEKHVHEQAMQCQCYKYHNNLGLGRSLNFTHFCSPFDNASAVLLLQL